MDRVMQVVALLGALLLVIGGASRGRSGWAGRSWRLLAAGIVAALILTAAILLFERLTG